MQNYYSLSVIRTDIDSGKLTVARLVDHYLSNIASRNEQLNAFLAVYDEEARATAISVDEKIKLGNAGKLAGMIIGIKDVLCYKDHRLQSSSRILEGFKSQFTATAIQRLIEEDAIIIGHQNCDEFAMGSSNENSAFGVVKNAQDEERVPGGSSGGSAVAVQADMCQVSLGTDTGGSVRQPAAFCGIVGLKPTYSRISRYGLTAYASSFDTIGILAKSVEDTALVLEVMAGEDENDSTVSKQPVAEYSKALNSGKKYKIGYISETLESQGLNGEVKEAVFNTIDQLKKDGYTVDELHFSKLDYVLPVYYIITTAEASSNLSRFDGVRYGYRAEAENLESMYKVTRTTGFGEEVKRRIMLGTFVLSASYYDAYYTKAQKVRRLIKEETENMLSSYDFIISPTTPTTAFKIGELMDNPIEMYLADLYTVQASVSGIPAISIPVGTDKNGLPIGVQIMSKSFNEAEILDISKQIISFG